MNTISSRTGESILTTLYYALSYITKNMTYIVIYEEFKA